MRIQILVFTIILLLMGLDIYAQIDTMVDIRDKTIYKTITIGSQVWLAENLKYFDDSVRVYVYNEHPYNYKNFGALYSWKMAIKACPPGWHLPDYSELYTLFSVKGKNKAEAYNYLIKDGNSGFDALLGGHLTNTDFGYYSGINKVGFYWSSTNNNSKHYAKCMMFIKKKSVKHFSIR